MAGLYFPPHFFTIIYQQNRQSGVIILGIETSCDETSAAVLEDGRVLSNIISSQLVHARYGGVVPELASRAHQRMIIDVVTEALTKAGVTKHDLHGIAATHGPGLVGALLVGLSFGKAMSYGLGVPFIGVNHMEGHLYSNFLLDESPNYPFISLIVSGGHTMLVLVEEQFKHRVLGQTRDDAAGEAFDKVAKMLGLGYPGGPIIDKLAKEGDPRAVAFPRAFMKDGTYDFSFSGIKTAVLYFLRQQGLLDEDASISAIDQQLRANICASFQASVVDVLVEKTFRAITEFGVEDVTMAGGVSANSHLRLRMKEEATKRGIRSFYPPIEYCMDNAAMIGYVGWMKLKDNVTSDFELPAVANLSL
ncbi:MAG: tRNA (adenosine(37)-N6)-threonylcarbamoyltransferase complex transferase subunit TsaD [Bacteroidota bacterium]